jgi:predicted SprT family Zn-dependent metalloprotease
MNLNEAKTLAIKLMDQHNLLNDNWYFEFNNRKRAFGVCNFRYKRISLSAPLTLINDKAAVLDTILHEIAHALVGIENGHNHIWKKKALEIGCNGKRCYNTDTVKIISGNYQATCNGCGKIHYKYRKPRNVGYCCAICSKGVYNVNFKLDWIKI